LSASSQIRLFYERNLLLGSISPNFVHQAKRRRHTTLKKPPLNITKNLSISIKNLIYNFVRYSPNLCAVCRSPFAKKASHLARENKLGKNVGEIDQRCQYHQHFYQVPFYETILHSFSLVTVWLCNFWCKNIGAKAARKMLMKLTPEGYFAINKKTERLNKIVLINFSSKNSKLRKEKQSQYKIIIAYTKNEIIDTKNDNNIL
jgi:hypothetical protein